MSKPKLLTVLDDTAGSSAYSKLNNPVNVNTNDNKLVVNDIIEVHDNSIITFKPDCNSNVIDYININGVDYQLLDTCQQKPSASWISGSIVTVILDCTNKIAYVQSSASSGSSGSTSSTGIPRRILVSLPVSGWDSTTKSQSLSVPGIAADESYQLIHIIPADFVSYTSSGINCAVNGANSLKFTATTIPTVDHNITIVVEDLLAYDPDIPDVAQLHAYTHAKNGLDPITPESIGAKSIDDSDVFIATYGTTTSAEIEAAYQAGKAMYCRKDGDNRISILVARGSSSVHIFQTVTSAYTVVRQCSNNTWSETTSAFTPNTHASTHASNGSDPVVKVYTATIGTTWTEDDNTGVKSQSVAISGVTASQTAKVDHTYTGSGTLADYATFVEAENQYLNCITNGYAETYDGGITFYIFGDVTTVEIPIVVEVA